jgi:phosphoenolpyruvate carboxykinase (GTP)
MKNNPACAPEADDPKGVPISAIIFGGRRATTIPLVYQAFNWIHGVYIGATMSSETTAAATGEVGKIRRDPMGMLPFCGYNMGHYFHHWLRMRKKLTNPPRIFYVNWFRRDEAGKFLWPGFGENMRVLKWIVDRTHGRADAWEAPLGWVPGPRDFDLGGMKDFDSARLAKAQEIDLEDWRREALSHDELVLQALRRPAQGTDLPARIAGGPTTITSGSCRKTWIKARLKERTSVNTSCCTTMARLFSCTNSIGSSMVTILQRRSPLMRSTR